MAKTFAISPRQRFELTQSIFHQKLGEKLSAVEDKKALGRCRLALGLTRISDLALDGSPVADEMAQDRKTLNKVELDDSVIDFLLTKIFTLEMQSYQVLALESFLDALDVAKSTGKAPPVDESLTFIPVDEQWERKPLDAEDEARFAVLIKDKAGHQLVGIRYTGQVELNKAGAVDEAARIFWSTVAELMPEKLKKTEGPGASAIPAAS